MNYTKRITVKAELTSVNNALHTGIAQWWTREVLGNAGLVGSEFTVRFGRTFKSFRVMEASSTTTQWLCVDAFLDSGEVKVKDEWKGTMVNWSVRPVNDDTEIALEHLGLTQALDCYSMCASGWEQFLGSLVDYLEVGDGRPWENSLI